MPTAPADRPRDDAPPAEMSPTADDATPVAKTGRSAARRSRFVRRVLGVACLAVLAALPAAARAGFYTTPFGRTPRAAFYAPAVSTPTVTTSYFAGPAFGGAPVAGVGFRPLFPRLAQRRMMRRAWRQSRFGTVPADAGYASSPAVAYYQPPPTYTVGGGGVDYGSDGCGSVISYSVPAPSYPVQPSFAPSSCAPVPCGPPPCQAACPPCGGTVIGGQLGTVIDGGCPDGNCGSVIVNDPVTPVENVEPLPDTRVPSYAPPDDRSPRDDSDPLDPRPERTPRTREDDFDRDRDRYQDRTPDPIRDDEFDRLDTGGGFDAGGGLDTGGEFDAGRDDPGGINFNLPDDPAADGGPDARFEPPTGGADPTDAFGPITDEPDADPVLRGGPFQGGESPADEFGETPGMFLEPGRDGFPEDPAAYEGEPSAVRRSEYLESFRRLSTDDPLTDGASTDDPSTDDPLTGSDMPPPVGVDAADAGTADRPADDATGGEAEASDGAGEDAEPDGAVLPESFGVRLSGADRPFRRTTLTPAVGYARYVRSEPNPATADDAGVRVAGN